MKKLLLLIVVALGVFLAGQAFASFMSPVDVDTTGYNFLSADYWTFTDFAAPNTSTNSEFSLRVEKAGFESAFGLYTVDDISNPMAIDVKYQIFAPADEPVKDKTLNVKFESGTTYVTLDPKNNPSAVWTAFDQPFGFYFDVQNTQQSYYTGMQFNSVDKNLEHVSTFYADGYAKALVLLDDQTGGGDRDFNDMVVKVTDVAPVPEPGTLLLLGSGLFGLGFLRRKRVKS